jgi:hypothetical protein
MTMLLAGPLHWEILLGTLVLTCWMAAGVATILGTPEEIRHGKTSKTCEYATTGLTGAGIISAVAMVAILVLA